MVIDGEDFTCTISMVAADYGWDSIQSQSDAHTAAIRWVRNNIERVRTWLARPQSYDVHSLLYRTLLTELGNVEPLQHDNKGLMYVIAAGNAVDELPCRIKFGHREFEADTEPDSDMEPQF